ncbi:urate hydroxylase PuuD [Kordiimonas sp. A6E486]|nr:urate hydroxylase PuuD [Kordiimonas marina]MCJ9430583.1 urate hydroxylase PuuD [Kordiimonas marina]
MPWLNLAIRWLHIITGIAWIGSSFYFIWLDNNLEKPKDPKPGMSGELWSVHGGGFYHQQKYAVAPEAMPEKLHWFKWEAYFTWMSGFALLAVIYYYGANLFLIDKAKMALTQSEAIGISLAFIIGGWFVYDGLCRSPLGRNNKAFGIVWFGVMLAAAYALTHIFSDRAAFIQVGAMVGTAMAANVFMVIIPNQKKVVAALTAGEAPDPRLGQMGKQRSLHNNYMTLPVLLIMVSNHYPMVFSNPNNWLVLAGLSLAGITIRHYFNLKHKGKAHPGVVVLAAVFFIGTMIFAAVSAGKSKVATGDVQFSQVQAIITKHCVMCHSAHPTHEGFEEAPMGVRFDDPALIQQYAPRIKMQAVDADIMPLGNETGMTDEERALLGKWIADGAKR